MEVLGGNRNGKSGAAESPRPQLVATTRKKPVSSATALNQHIKAAVIRLAFDSCLEINKFSYIAKYAGTRESVALNVIREYVRDLRGGVRPPTGPTVIRRRAA